MYLARKITRAKWEPGPEFHEGELPADAVTVDMKTSGNTLSFWLCGDAGETALRRVVLTLAAAAHRVDRLDLVWIEQAKLTTDGIVLKKTKGKTPVDSMVEKHVDAVKLDFVRLGLVAGRIAGALVNERHKRWTKREVREILINGVEKDLVELEKLQDKVKAEVSKALREKEQREKDAE